MYTSKKLYTPNWLKDTQNQANSTCCTISTLVKDGVWSSTLLNVSMYMSKNMIYIQLVERYTLVKDGAWSSTLLNQLQLTLLSLRADHGVLVSQYFDRFTFKKHTMHKRYDGCE